MPEPGVTSAPPPYTIRRPGAGIAQLVEQRIRNARVVGSNPIPGTIHFRRERSNSAEGQKNQKICKLRPLTAAAANTFKAVTDERVLKQHRC